MTDESLESEVRKQLGKWFGSFEVSSWVLLRIYRIPFAQPNQVNLKSHNILNIFLQTPPTDLERSVRLGRKLYICGDHRDSSTFDGKYECISLF